MSASLRSFYPWIIYFSSFDSFLYFSIIAIIDTSLLLFVFTISLQNIHPRDIFPARCKNYVTTKRKWNGVRRIIKMERYPACRIFISKNKISKLLIKHQQEEKGKKVFALAFETASGDGGRGGGGGKN